MMDVMEERGEVTEEQQRAVKRGSKVKMSPMRSEEKMRRKDESNEESTQSMRTRSKRGPENKVH